MNKMKPSFDAVLFDCDGVLVDSEPITNGVLRDMLCADVPLLFRSELDAFWLAIRSSLLDAGQTRL